MLLLHAVSDCLYMPNHCVSLYGAAPRDVQGATTKQVPAGPDNIPSTVMEHHAWQNIEGLYDITDKVRLAWEDHTLCGVMHKSLKWRNIMYSERLDTVRAFLGKACAALSTQSCLSGAHAASSAAQWGMCCSLPEYALLTWLRSGVMMFQLEWGRLMLNPWSWVAPPMGAATEHAQPALDVARSSLCRCVCWILRALFDRGRQTLKRAARGSRGRCVSSDNSSKIQSQW